LQTWTGWAPSRDFARSGIEFTLGGEPRTLGPGGLARVDAATVRSLRNISDSAEATYVCVGGAGGYVGRDGVSDAAG
jgi:hypothetical protein